MAVETEAVIDIGASTTTLVVHSNGILQFVRLLKMGSGRDYSAGWRSGRQPSDR